VEGIDVADAASHVLRFGVLLISGNVCQCGPSHGRYERQLENILDQVSCSCANDKSVAITMAYWRVVSV
jgi:hypothetical protein